MIDVLRPALGLTLGVMAGWSFGLVQQAALRRYQKRQNVGNSIGIMSVIPGSMQRVAYFLILLAVIQLVCPVLFVGMSQWCVSAGVVIGYGVLLYKQLRERMA